MQILAIETASEACSVALFTDQQLVAHDWRLLGRGHAEDLVPMIAALPDKGRCDRILVSLGPGSFTGVRIGLATARALGVAWKAEVLGYPTLSLIHQQANLNQASGDQPRPGTVCINGGHGEWFIQNFAANGHAQTELKSLTPAQAAQFPLHAMIAGNRAQDCAACAEEQGVDEARLALEILPDAKYAISLPSDHFTSDLRPIYGRAPDAKPAAARVAS